MGRPALRSADSSVVKVRRSPREDLNAKVFPRPRPGTDILIGMTPVFRIFSTAPLSSDASTTPSTVVPSGVAAV